MRNFKHITLLHLLLAVFALHCGAQTVSYTYDQAGNRTSRTTITLPPPPQNAKQHTEATDSVVVKDMIGERTITVFPNPTKGALGINIAGENYEDNMNITLFNGQGQLLINIKATIGLNSVDLTRYPAGWYILQLQTGTTKKEYKIIKQ